MAQPQQTYYEILKVKPSATPEQIRVAYRQLAKTAHPDAGGSSADMAALTEAYQTLKDPIARLDYDQSIAPAPPEARYAAAPSSNAGYSNQPGQRPPTAAPPARVSRDQARAVRQYVWSFVQEFGWLAVLGGAALTWLSFQPLFGTSGWVIGLCGTALLYWAALQVVYLAWPEFKLSNYHAARAPHRVGGRRLKQLVVTSLLWLPIGLVVQIAVRLAF